MNKFITRINNKLSAFRQMLYGREKTKYEQNLTHYGNGAETEFTQQFNIQIVNATKAEALNHGEPQPWPGRNIYQQRMCWQMKSFQFDQMKHYTIGTKSMVLSRDNYYCKTPFEELKPTTLREMQLPMVHKGQYLACRVIDRPLPFVGVSTLIQDLNGDVEEVIIYNYSYDIFKVDWLSEGTIMIIKEPWLRYGMSGDSFSLRIDSPSDIIFVDPSDSEFLNQIGANKWFEQKSDDSRVICKEAQECFVKNDFDAAMKLYDRGIRCNPELPILYLNKSLTCLRTGAFYMAYENAKIGLEKGGDREKALRRMGLAAYGMREWQKAANHFSEVLQEFPNNKFASDELQRAHNRTKEQKSGRFNFKKMEFENELDVSDFTGPIEIVDIPKKGRGIIASKDIQKGTLLVVSKSFASSYSKDFSGDLIVIDLIRNGLLTVGEWQLGIRAMENLQKNPQNAKEVYDLYSGNLKETEEIPDGVIDALRINLICALNGFGSIDSLSVSINTHLFILPSYFNHSCIANAHHSIYGDVMVIRASTNIKKGDEICLAYTHPLTPYRSARLKSWQFKCHCRLCNIEAEDGNSSKRTHIYYESVKYSKNPSRADVNKLESLLKQMRKTYSIENDYKIHLSQMLFNLSTVYYGMDEITKSISCLEEVLFLMPDPLEYVLDVTQVRVNLAIFYYSAGQISKAQEMIQKAYDLSLCSDVYHFKSKYPEIAEIVEKL